MDVDVIKAKQIPFKYVSPPFCEFIFSASSATDIFLNTRVRGGSITGFTITFVDGVYQLRWDTFPGALCYSVYKLVDELDPYSGYVLVVECITDNFVDLTDPGAYVVVPVTPDGEGNFPDNPVPTPTPPPTGCESPNPSGTGIDQYACSNADTTIDVSGNNTGLGLSISSASADQGTVTFTGMSLTYVPPDGGFSGTALISYTVTDQCGKTASNAVLLRALTAPTFSEPARQDVCDDGVLNVDVTDYIDVPLDETDEQTITVNSASITGRGGSLVYGDGPNITFTPNAGDFGNGDILFSAQNQCGDTFGGEIPVRVFCGGCEQWFDTIAGWTADVDSGAVWSVSPDNAQITAVINNGGLRVNSGTYGVAGTSGYCNLRIVGEIVGNGVMQFYFYGSYLWTKSGAGSFDVTIPFFVENSVTNFMNIYSVCGGNPANSIHYVASFQTA